ncbi:MAG: HD domain-containing protein [Ardenticatenaceae bacterium]|nr:HD domain-containing protein [Ardenticatenaceae bacterium]
MAINLEAWQPKFKQFISEQLDGADLAHDLAHVERVVANAHRLALLENGRLDIVLPAAWLHDCVIVPKNSPQRKLASQMAAEKASEFLNAAGYPSELIPGIQHAVAAHSFSAGIIPRTVEAKVVQDADRLDSLGSIGIARCLLTGVSFGAEVYQIDDPFGENRPLDDKKYSVDHFYVKLFKLADMMQTAAGRAEAAERTRFMRAFLDQLRQEITVTKVT